MSYLSFLANLLCACRVGKKILVGIPMCTGRWSYDFLHGRYNPVRTGRCSADDATLVSVKNAGERDWCAGRDLLSCQCDGAVCNHVASLPEGDNSIAAVFKTSTLSTLNELEVFLAREASPVCCLYQVDEDTFGGFYEAFVACCVEFSKF